MSVRSFRRLVPLVVMATGLTLSVGRTQAQYIWTATASGTWSNAGNWTGGAPVPGTTTTLTFGAGTYTATDDIAATPFVLNKLTFGASGTATLSDSGQGLSFAGTSPSITMGAGNAIINQTVGLGANTSITGATGTLTLNGAVSDGGSGFNLTNTAIGSLVLAGGGSFNSLNLQAGSTSDSAGALLLNGQLAVSGATPTSLSILNGGKVFVGGASLATAALSSGNVTLSGFGSALKVLGQSQVGGTGGTTGGVSVITDGAGASVNLVGSATLYAGASLVANGGPFGSFIVGGLNDGLAGISTGTVSVGGGSTFTIGTSGNTATFSGSISGSGGVTKSGLGTQVLLGSNSYTGPTNINGGILNFTNLGNLGSASAINFNGGTLQYSASGNTTDISAAPTVVTFLAGGATIDTNGNNVTFASAVGNSGNGGLTKVGAGTLTLGATNAYFGGTNVLNGTLSVSADANLGSGNVTGAAAGTLAITGTTSTSKSFAMGGGAIAVSSTQTVTVVGGIVSGAVLNGVGAGALATVATDPTAGAQFIGSSSTSTLAVTSNSANDQFVNFSNGGPMTVAANVNTTGASTIANLNGFNNLGSGTLTIGGATHLQYANFQSSGTLTVSPAVVGSGNSTLLTNAGTSPMYFNGGSETFIGTAATVGPSNNPNFVAGIDLHGSNAIVQGGLFVNNGYVVDSSTAGTATVVADFGSLVQGAGFFQNTVITQNGGKFKAGNCPGETSFGNFVMGPGGVNNDIFYINNATGTAGPVADAAGNVSGWSLVKTVKQAVGTTTTSGDFTWTATPSNPMLVALDTLVNPSPVGVDVVGPMANFDPTKAYSWLAGQWTGTYSGPTDPAALDAATAFNTSAFVNQIEGSFGWSLDLPDDKLFLTYTPSPVPEPGTLALVGATGLVAGWWRRRKAARAKVS